MGVLLIICIGRGRVAAQSSSAGEGGSLFAANCAACHGSDGRSGERAPNIATRREVVMRPDDDLRRTIEKGVAGNGMPGFAFLGEDKITALVHYLRKLQGVGAAAALPGDAMRGRTVFFGKADCAQCHTIDGKGGFLASDLDGYGVGRTAAEVRNKITDPDSKLDRSAQWVTIVPMNGQSRSGFIRSQDNFALVLQAADGAFVFFARDTLARIEYSGHSSMPLDYANRLSSGELDDVVSYLMQSRSADKHQKHEDDDE